MSPNSDKTHQTKVITIGRTPSNTIVIDQSNVSSQHARITITEEGMILEDLGSTNGTSIGKVENKISRGVIHPTDTVYFGSIAYKVADLLGIVGSAETPLPEPQGTTKEPSSQRNKTAIIAGVASLVISIILLMMVDFGDENPTNGAGEQRTASGETTPLDDENVIPQSNQSQPVSGQDFLEKSLFFVVVFNPDENLAFRIGNSFAIDEQHLATTASVITALKQFQNDGYRDAFLFNPATTEKITISSMKTHPQYDEAKKEARTAQNAYDALIQQYSLQPPQPAELEAVEQELIKTKAQALAAMEKQAIYDAAVMTTLKPLKYWIPSGEQSPPFRPNLKLTIQSLAFDIQDPFFDPQESIEVSALESRFQQLAKLSDDIPPRLLARIDSEHVKSSYIGSPILLSDGTVVALYSRPTPPIGEDPETESDSTFDGPLYDRIRECLER